MPHILYCVLNIIVMSFKKYIDRLYYVDYLIRTKSTGDIISFGKKLQLSKSSVHEMLKEMKELGFPIQYCSRRKTYYYSENGQMIENLFLRDRSEKEDK